MHGRDAGSFHNDDLQNNRDCRLMTRCFSHTLFSIACFGCSGVDGSENGIYIGGVPTEIHDLMNERGCSPIADFYARAVYLPPFIVERSPNLVAFVCQIDEPVGDDKYKLVIGERVRSNTESGFGFSSLNRVPKRSSTRTHAGRAIS